MKIKTSETVTLKRSEIEFAAYNPRKKSKEVVDGIKKNFKKVGYLGGIVVNKNGTLISGHKRIEAMDLIYKFDGSKNDYDVKIELADLDPKTEKEQNIYMNNKAVQGEFDYEILAGISKDIDFENAGLTEFDLDKIAVFAPTANIETPIAKKELTPEQKEQNIENLKELKKKIRNDFYDDHDDASKAHLTLVFENYANKVAFMESMELDSETKMVKGEEFAEKINIFE